MADEPHWADIASAIGTCATGLAAAILSWRAYVLEKNRHKHEILPERKRLYEEFKSYSTKLMASNYIAYLCLNWDSSESKLKTFIEDRGMKYLNNYHDISDIDADYVISNFGNMGTESVQVFLDSMSLYGESLARKIEKFNDEIAIDNSKYGLEQYMSFLNSSDLQRKDIMNDMLHIMHNKTGMNKYPLEYYKLRIMGFIKLAMARIHAIRLSSSIYLIMLSRKLNVKLPNRTIKFILRIILFR